MAHAHSVEILQQSLHMCHSATIQFNTRAIKLLSYYTCHSLYNTPTVPGLSGNVLV